MPDAPNWTTEISLNMRMVLIDWLIEVTEEYHLQDQTLLLAIIYLDKCLHRKVNVSKDLLQLLGISCLFVATYVYITNPLLTVKAKSKRFFHPL